MTLNQPGVMAPKVGLDPKINKMCTDIFLSVLVLCMLYVAMKSEKNAKRVGNVMI